MTQLYTDNLTPTPTPTPTVAIAIARIREEILGYGHVKERHLAAA